RPRFDWPGVYIETVFTGASCAVMLEDAGNTYAVFIDGVLRATLTGTPGQTLYPIADGLSPGSHTFALHKRSEASFGVATFEGLLLEPRQTIEPPAPAPERRLLFLGDSVIAGYGNEAAGPEEPFSAQNSNAYHAFGPVLARRLGAAYHMVAISGIGLVRNYGAPGRRSLDPFPVYAPRGIKADASSVWAPASWQPDALVIRLGRNDFSTRPAPWGFSFRRALTRFLTRLRGGYPDTPIVYVTVPRLVDPHHRHVTRIAERLNTDGAWVHIAPFEMGALDKPGDYGSDWHPNVAGHRKIADAVEPVLRDAAGW
ncbi:MAG: SGNH/GDSL hydrolase family protein, partial [Bacteroidota bacterium]